MPSDVSAVLFDLHGTLLDQGTAAGWLEAAERLAGAAAPGRDALLGFLDRIWENARVHDPLSRRDLDPVVHREVFHALLDERAPVPRDVADALYATLLDGWTAYADSAEVLAALRAAGVRTVLVSNVGVDVRQVLRREGLADLLDDVLLSCEAGVVKPDPEFFRRALAVAGVPAEAALMVGDSADDAGACAVGVRTLLLPRASGPVHGLAAVLDLVGLPR